MRKIKKINTKAVALCGVMTALAIVFGYIEHLIPMPFGIYGLKLGLANLAVVIALYALNEYYAISINATRIILCSILFGSFTSFWYSLVGGILSFAVMALIKKINKFSLIGVSVCGAIAHNAGQIIVAIIITEEFKIAFYLPVLLIAGAITGTLIGVIAMATLKAPIFKSKQKTD